MQTSEEKTVGADDKIDAPAQTIGVTIHDIDPRIFRKTRRQIALQILVVFNDHELGVITFGKGCKPRADSDRSRTYFSDHQPLAIRSSLLQEGFDQMARFINAFARNRRSVPEMIDSRFRNVIARQFRAVSICQQQIQTVHGKMIGVVDEDGGRADFGRFRNQFANDVTKSRQPRIESKHPAFFFKCRQPAILENEETVSEIRPERPMLIQNRCVNTAESLLDLLRYVIRRTIDRGIQHKDRDGGFGRFVLGNEARQKRILSQIARADYPLIVERDSFEIVMHFEECASEPAVIQTCNEFTVFVHQFHANFQRKRRGPQYLNLRRTYVSHIRSRSDCAKSDRNIGRTGQVARQIGEQGDKTMKRRVNGNRVEVVGQIGMGRFARFEKLHMKLAIRQDTNIFQKPEVNAVIQPELPRSPVGGSAVNCPGF
ncbi:hypothetical protein D3C80_140770 [compost metagenome]